jgi:hypothetical protein
MGVGAQKGGTLPKRTVPMGQKRIAGSACRPTGLLMSALVLMRHPFVVSAKVGQEVRALGQPPVLTTGREREWRRPCDGGECA